MKQVILVREDLKLPKGKLAVQVAHASLSAYIDSHSVKRDSWAAEGMAKVALKVTDLNELMDFHKRAKQAGLVSVVIKDAGKTVVVPGTVTCIGIGPDEEQKIDKLTGSLKMI